METKLSTYWISSFSKICLGMKIDQQLRFIVIHKRADSLYSLITDGQYRYTSLGRDTWRSLTGPKASSQMYCNREGFDLYPLTAYWEFKTAKARIGFITNNANNCNDVDVELDLVQEGHMMTKTRVESLQMKAVLIMGRNS